MLLKLLINSILILKVVKYVIVEVPKTEKFLKKEGYDGFHIRLFSIMLVCGKMIKTFLSGCVIYFAIPMIIAILKYDNHILDEIREIIRILNNH